MLKKEHSCLYHEAGTTGSIVCSDTWKAYTGFAAKGYVSRLVHHKEDIYSYGRDTISMGWKDSGDT
jgi:hypothetical protein